MVLGAGGFWRKTTGIKALWNFSAFLAARDGTAVTASSVNDPTLMTSASSTSITRLR
jgi:hypothetical protein